MSALSHSSSNLFTGSLYPGGIHPRKGYISSTLSSSFTHSLEGNSPTFSGLSRYSRGCMMARAVISRRHSFRALKTSPVLCSVWNGFAITSCMILGDRLLFSVNSIMPSMPLILMAQVHMLVPYAIGAYKDSVHRFLPQRRVVSREIYFYDLKQSVGSGQAWDARNPANPGRAGPRSSV